MNTIKSLILFLFPLMCFSQQLKQYTFEEVEKLQLKSPRNTVVFLHTQWCKFCKIMDKTTFENQQVIQMLNNHYYYINFDAESTSPITFAGNTFKYIPSGNNTGVHSLAQALAQQNGQLVYPSIVVLNPENEIIFSNGGALNPDEMITILNTIK